jgi:uncharacterized protein involved in exopolysaccharide biosynthesis
VATRWPSVSLAIVDKLVDGVNAFNLRTRQGQAAAERKFVEGRLALASSELRAAEDRLERFLTANRQSGSPELAFQRERLQRDVTSRQQLFTVLTQSYEEVRMREVRDTPAITMVEPPSVLTERQPLGRLKWVLFGLLLGAFLGGLGAFTREVTARRQKEGDAEAHAFVATLGEVKGEVLRPLRLLREKRHRS